MGFLICEKCGGYYELAPGETPKQFTACECGGKLKYTKTLQPNESLGSRIETKIQKLHKTTVVILYIALILFTFIFLIVATKLAIVTVLLLIVLFMPRRKK